MNNPHITKLLREHPVTKAETRSSGSPPEEATNPRVARERALTERLRQTVLPEQRLDLPVVSAAALIEEAKIYPLNAAMACRKGISLLENGHQRQLRWYIAAAYAITCGVRDNERYLKLFASEVRDGRSKSPPSVEKVQGNLLQLVFRHIFAESGATTRNRAYQYAYGLQDSYNLGKSVDEVSLRVVRYGPEKLYRAAAKRAHLIEAAKELEASGREPAMITEDAVLAELTNEQSDEEPTDFGWRELPPDDEEWVNEVEAALHEPMPRDDDDDDINLGEEPEGDHSDGDDDDDDDDDDHLYPAGFDDDDEREDLQAADSRLALLAKMVVELEVGLSELRAMIRSL